MKLRDFFQRKSIRYSLAGFATSIMAYGLWQVGTPVVKEYRSSFAAHDFKEHGVAGTYKKHFFSFIGKLDEMKALDQENQELNRKVASLEKEIELTRADHAEKEAKEHTTEVSQHLRKEAGSELARVLDSIEYKSPSNLLPTQLYSLGVGYFRKQEYEQAAVILSQLIELKEDSSFQKAETQLMCGIAWYKLKHFKLARQYLFQTKYKSEPSDAIYRTALVWEALTAKAEGKTDEAQKIVINIISRYPHSEEAAWVNQVKETKRKPSSFDGHEFPAFERNIDSANQKHEEHQKAEAKAHEKKVEHILKSYAPQTKEEHHED